ncbi:MAG TPA: DUF2232 domain-containing protein [Candidatus Competibacteraceae bacterium]|nr:DUF2232 domain-containing protein [Candidatus Competibacteraceae bacterium]
MSALASFVMRGRLQAALVTAVSAWLLPPFSSVIGNAVVALATLRRGMGEGALLMLLAAAGLCVLALPLFGQAAPLLALSLGLLYWLPVWLLAGVLRTTVSLPLALLTGVALGLLALLLTYAWLGDPAARWVELLGQFKPLFQEAGLQVDEALVDQWIRYQAPFLTGLTVVLQLAVVYCGLLLGRAWQARLYNPDGFRQEFHGLRLGRTLALAAATSIVLAGVLGQIWLVNLALLLGLLFVFQGLALLHGLVGLAGLSKGWLVALYVLLSLALPQMLLLLSLIGILDAWIDLRARVKPKSPLGQ